MSGAVLVDGQPQTKPGTMLEDILSHLFDTGMEAGATREEYIAWRRDVIARRFSRPVIVGMGDRGGAEGYDGHQQTCTRHALCAVHAPCRIDRAFPPRHRRARDGRWR